MIRLTGQVALSALRLPELVTAIVNADEHDEADWVEWKSTLDLTRPSGTVHLSRAILGFANRDPQSSQQPFGGTAYLLVGVAPGDLQGVRPVDLEKLQPKLARYIGTPGPFWRHHYVPPAEKPDLRVLVIEVPPPRNGDYPYPWRTDYQPSSRSETGAASGTLFIRRGSRTERANYEEVLMLVRRAAQTPQLDGLKVGHRIDAPGAIVVIDPTTEQVDAWVDARRDAIVDHHRKAIAAMDKPDNLLAAAMFQPRIDQQAIEQHLELCRNQLLDATLHALIEARISLLTMTVTSPGPQILDDVELTLTINTRCSAFEENHIPDKLHPLPAPPDPPKRRPPLNFGISLERPDPSWMLGPRTNLDLPLPDPGIEIDDGTITLAIGGVRPDKPVLSTAFHLFLHERPADGLRIDWTLTSRSTQGVQHGSTTLPVHPTQAVLLPATLPNEDDSD